MKLLCPDCGKQYESGKFCQECGAKLQEAVPELVCPSCGYKPETGKFCPECGTKLTEHLVATSTEANKEPAKKIFKEKDPRLAKYYTKRGYPRTIPQEERAIAIEELTPLANQGIAEAKMLLGIILLLSKDTVIKATDLIKEAEKEGDKFAYYLTGYLYFKGWSVEPNHDEAEKRMLEMYHEYPIDGASSLAELYAYSLEKCDYKKAFEYATSAAENDEIEGYMVLGDIYLNGWGKKKNFKKALDNYKIAAAMGDETAMNQIGFIYMGNKNFKANPEQSYYWFNESAKKGSDIGMYNLGCCYQNGYGIEADAEQAAKWFKKSAELGYIDAMVELGGYYQNVLIDAKKAKTWYQKAAELGNAEAQNKLAVIYYDIEKDYKNAIKWYKKAMEQDEPWSYRNYAFCFWNGFGVKENKKKAMEMMQKAISLGLTEAENDLNEMRKAIEEETRTKINIVKVETQNVLGGGYAVCLYINYKIEYKNCEGKTIKLVSTMTPLSDGEVVKKEEKLKFNSVGSVYGSVQKAKDIGKYSSLFMLACTNDMGLKRSDKYPYKVNLSFFDIKKNLLSSYDFEIKIKYKNKIFGKDEMKIIE